MANTIDVVVTDLTYPPGIALDPALPVTLMLIKKAIVEQTGKDVPDLEKKLLNKIIGREDGAARTIWTHTQPLTSDPKQTITMTGAGTQGDYSLTLEIEVS